MQESGNTVLQPSPLNKPSDATMQEQSTATTANDIPRSQIDTMTDMVNQAVQDVQAFEILRLASLFQNPESRRVQDDKEYFLANIERLYRLQGKPVLKAVFLVPLLTSPPSTLQDGRKLLSKLAHAAKEFDLDGQQERRVPFDHEIEDTYYTAFCALFDQHKLHYGSVVQVAEALSNAEDIASIPRFKHCMSEYPRRLDTIAPSDREPFRDLVESVFEEWLFNYDTTGPSCCLETVCRELSKKVCVQSFLSFLLTGLTQTDEFTMNSLADAVPDVSPTAKANFVMTARPLQTKLGPHESPLVFKLYMIATGFNWILKNGTPNQYLLRHLGKRAVRYKQYNVPKSDPWSEFWEGKGSVFERIEKPFYRLVSGCYAKAFIEREWASPDHLARLVVPFGDAKEAELAKGFLESWEGTPKDGRNRCMERMKDFNVAAMAAWLVAKLEGRSPLFEAIQKEWLEIMEAEGSDNMDETAD